jgi:hypothetical protein
MKTIRMLAITAFSVGVVATSANAFSTIGDRSCGKWSTRRQNPYVEASSEAWLMGYMTGLASASEKDVLADTDGESIILWMDNYCRTHPLDRVGAGGATLFFELMGRKRQ